MLAFTSCFKMRLTTFIKFSYNQTHLQLYFNLHSLEWGLTYANCITDMGRLWFDLPPQVAPRFQRMILPKGISYKKDEGLGTATLGSIFELNRQSRGQKS